jgi:KUP system potassium uptake protein
VHQAAVTTRVTRGTPNQRTRPSRGDTSVALSFGALGVVFGDIGTSPLYALKACFGQTYGLVPTPMNVAGLVSLIVWTLILVVSVKYVAFIMRADNHGEGGIFALLALILPVSRRGRSTRAASALVALGLMGAALLYGDGVITPAISVLSAVEGVTVAAPALARFVVPASLLILLVLFEAQRFGTTRIGRVFGPLMLLWFATIAVLGGLEVIRTPGIVRALDPVAGVRFVHAHGVHALFVLGAVVLAVTGAEALYADMGHFGKRPIRLAWFWIVFPALVLNYLGQGALILRAPQATANPFFLLAPAWLLYPLVLLSTLATIVASQALISGAFSLTQQAIQLGYAPRMRIVHTSASAQGQIYIPIVNSILMVACLLIVILFRSSERLAAAYGIAVTGTMAVTSVLFYAVARSRWGWSAVQAGLLTTLFLLIDLTFFGTNLLKVVEGGWVPLTLGAIVYVLMSTWRSGHDSLVAMRRQSSLPIETMFRILDENHVVRVPGAAIFFTPTAEGAPALLLRQIEHMKALQETVVLLVVTTASQPAVPVSERVTVETLSHGFVSATAHIGFMQPTDAVEIVTALRSCIALPLDDLVYYTSREQVTPTGAGGMARWRKRLFAFMARNAGSMASYFHIPPDSSVELGMTVEL